MGQLYSKITVDLRPRAADLHLGAAGYTRHTHSRTPTGQTDRGTAGLKEMDEESHSAVVVPHTELEAEMLRSVIESFVLREGTDYGEREFSLEDKVRRVMRQIERGEAQIVFDPRTDSVDIVTVSSARMRTDVSSST
jgi:uncharacterized protein YheU (UPF0270 family)